MCHSLTNNPFLAFLAMQVRMYLKSVNGKDVLYWNHKQVSQEILRGQNIVNLEVMTHFKGNQWIIQLFFQNLSYNSEASDTPLLPGVRKIKIHVAEKEDIISQV